MKDIKHLQGDDGHIAIKIAGRKVTPKSNVAHGRSRRAAAQALFEQHRDVVAAKAHAGMEAMQIHDWLARLAP